MISALMIGAQQWTPASFPISSAPTSPAHPFPAVMPHLCPAVPPPVPLCSATYL
ncbi:unnamed protein product, partial [Staurois parvus]